MSDFDKLLFRKLAIGSVYENLIPPSSCKPTALGVGQTDFSIKHMAQIVNDDSHQMAKVAKLLSKNSLEDTVDAIFDFCYNHFQYKADDDHQMLRTPACSWADRKNGIDCKSYSIIASSLLTEMGINHYIRKIKQPGFAPSEFTHVYVVVPQNQDSNDLAAGYYVIDGTISDNSEPAFIQKQDLFMNGLPHSKLAGPSWGDVTNILGGSSPLKDLDIKNWIGNLSCLGGSAYDKPKLDANVTKITAVFSDLIQSMNNNLRAGNYDDFSEDVADYRGYARLFQNTYTAKKNGQDWRSACTVKNFDATIKLCQFFNETTTQLLNAYLSKYFIAGSIKGSMNYTSARMEEDRGFWGMYLGNPQTVSMPLTPFTPVPATDIPAFEIPAYVVESAQNNTPLNINQFFQALQTVATVIGSTSGNNSQYPTNPDMTYDINGNPIAPKQSGFGVMGIVLVAAGIYVAADTFSKMPNKGNAKNAKK